MTNEELKELKRFILNASLAQGFTTYMFLKYKDVLPSLTPGELGALRSELQHYRAVMSEMLRSEGAYPVEEEFPELFGAEVSEEEEAKIFGEILEKAVSKVRSE